jgi:hypothetical protein
VISKLSERGGKTARSGFVKSQAKYFPVVLHFQSISLAPITLRKYQELPNTAEFLAKSTLPPGA